MSRTRKIALLLFGSGLAALVYQTAWERMLRLVFGASTGASSAVLAIFLGGLGVGGIFLGRRAERSARPLVLYGNLELGVALTAGLTPFLVDLVRSIYYGIGGTTALGGAGAIACRLALSALVLGPSVVLMGGTLPAAARAAESEEDRARGRAALLYAANTAGAVVGALLGTFVLFELFGTRLALWTAALINALVAMLARRIGAKLPEIAVRESSDEPAAAPSLRTHVVYGAAALVGFVFVAQEIVWYRVLGPILGGSSFTFGLILAVALAGIGIGGFVYSRRGESRAASFELLAWTTALEAAFFAFPLALGDGVGLLAAYTRAMSGLGFTALTLTWTAITALVVLPGSIVAGYQFPVLFALLGQGRDRVARQIGVTYAFNTAGSIAGAIAVGFMLFPAIGAIGVWKLAVFILVLLVIALLVISYRERDRFALRALAGSLAVVALYFSSASGPSAASRHTAIGAGRVPIVNADRNGLREWIHWARLRLLWERDGVESTVGVVKDKGIAFLVNGKSDGSVTGDRGTQVLLGLLPSLLHPKPKSAFVLGLGTGQSAGWLASVPGMERVDVAELEPAVLGVARDCAPANQNVLGLPNAHVLIGDGRELLIAQKRKYDIIVSEPSNPYRAGIASLFTQDFYRLAGEHLAPDGVFGQWVQGYEIDAQTMRIVLATLRSAFPVVEIWQTQGGDFLMVGSFAPRVIDVDQLRARVAAEPYLSALPRAALVSDAEGVLSRFLIGPDLTASISRVFDPPINTDDAMVLEYAFARHVGASGLGIPIDLVSLSLTHDFGRPAVRGQVDWVRVDEQRGRAWLISNDRGPPLPIRDVNARARANAIEAGCGGDVNAAHRAWTSQSLEPRDPIERYVVGMALAQQADERSLALAEDLAKAGFVAERNLIVARFNSRAGKTDEAFAALEAALGELRKTAMPLCDTAKAAIEGFPQLTRGNPVLAARGARALLAGPLAVYAEDELRIKTAQKLAFESGSNELCVQALGKNLELPWWNEPFLTSRAACLEAANHPLKARARSELAEWHNASLGRIGAGLNLPVAQPAAAPSASAP